MSKPAPQNRSYKAALGRLSGPRFHADLSVDFEAATDAEAAEKAMEWALKNVRGVYPHTELQLTSDGRVVHREKLEWHSAPRS
jgi:hypothetical protein